MAIPKYNEVMLPLLQLVENGTMLSVSDSIDKLAKEFGLTDEERREKLPSGQDILFNNRVRWAQFHLRKAALLESPERGYFRITKRGLDVLSKKPQEINTELLLQFPEFRSFVGRDSQDSKGSQVVLETGPTSQTPLESIAQSSQILRAVLTTDLLEKLKLTSPSFFERVVVDLLVKMGYGGSLPNPGQITGKSGDEGIDGLIYEDKLGLDIVYIQAKRWAGTVGRPVVQGFVGSLEGKRAQKGIIITTSTFSDDAIDYAKSVTRRIVLIDGQRLAELMIDHEVGVSTVETYAVRRLDSDYFIED